jgi:hypothetical protein
MKLAPFAASVLLVLDPGALGTSGSLHRTDAALRPTAPALRIPSSALGFAWARSGPTVAFVAKASATGQPVRILDVSHWRIVRTIAVGDRDVCGLTFAGRSLLALAADQPCYWAHGHFILLRLDIARGRLTRAIPVTGLDNAPPPSLAFGDGRAFVARASGIVDAVDLAMGTTVRHAPRRSLAKGGSIVWTRWLGGHLLATGNRILDVRTWRMHLLPRWVRTVAPAGRLLAAYGTRGVAVYTRAGVLRFRLLAGEDVWDAHVVAGRLYASVGWGTDVLPLRPGAHPTVAANPSPVAMLLAP